MADDRSPEELAAVSIAVQRAYQRGFERGRAAAGLPVGTGDLRAEMARTLRHELRLVAGPESRIPDALADAVLALPAVQEALAAADAVKRVEALAAELDADLDSYGYRIRNGLDPSPGDRLRRALAGEETS